jgi:hypothetical protein
MEAKPKNEWHLNPAEVTWGTKSLNIGGRGAARESRAKDITACQIELVHIPTGTKVVGEVPQGHYTRKQMQIFRAQLWPQLFSELESRVARVLHIPRR